MKKKLLSLIKYKKIIFTGSIVSVFIASTRFASAQGLLSGASFRDIAIGLAKYLTNTIIPMIVGIALLYFLWNMGLYVKNMFNEKEREQFKKYSINGLVALFIILSLWGIIAIFTGTVFNTSPAIPQFPTKD